MTIVYTGNFRFPAQDAASARVINNAKALKELGHTVKFLSWGGSPREEDKLPDGQYVYQGFEYVNTSELLDGKRSVAKKLKSMLSRGRKTMTLLKMMPNVKMVIAYNPPLCFTWNCQKYCSRNGIFFVTDITEWYASNEFPGGSCLPFYWMNELNMKWMQKKVKNKIVISSYLNNYYNHSNNLLVPPLVDLSEQKWKKKQVSIPDVITRNHSIKLLFAGNPAQKDLLVNILQSVVRFGGRIQIIVLGVSEANANLYINMEERRQYPDSIVFLGRVPQDDVPFYYSMVDFSVIVREPNRKNTAGFPTKMAESYAAGCPVMLNGTSDLLEYVNDGINAIVLTDFKVNSINRGFKQLLALKQEELDQMKINAKVTGKELFDYKTRISSFQNFTQNLC